MRSSEATGRSVWAARAGFTLMEMMVVIALVAAIAVMALPSVIALYDSGADSQAYNLLAAQLTAARALAIRNATYAGVHVQLADARSNANDANSLYHPKLKDACFSAMVLYDRKIRRFQCYGLPQRMPGNIAFGKLSGSVSGGTATIGSSGYNASGVDDKPSFTTFTVVFAPTGSAVRTVEGRNVTFDPNDRAFARDPNALRSDNVVGSQQLWEYSAVNSPVQPAVTAVTLFDVSRYNDATSKTTFLNENGQYVPLNIHTGQLFPRE